MDSAGERFEVVRAALTDRSNVLTVKELCQLAGVSRSGYYNWMSSQRARELREERDRAAFEQIRRRTGSGAMPRASVGSICGSCTWASA